MYIRVNIHSFRCQKWAVFELEDMNRNGPTGCLNIALLTSFLAFVSVQTIANRNRRTLSSPGMWLPQYAVPLP